MSRVLIPCLLVKEVSLWRLDIRPDISVGGCSQQIVIWTPFIHLRAPKRRVHNHRTATEQ